MKKVSTFGIILLLGGIATTTAVFYTSKNKQIIAVKNAAQPLVFAPETGKEWVIKCTERYPELLWLADTNVRKTEEGHASFKDSYSEQLFGKKYVEFDRTVMTLQCLRWVLEGSDAAYEAFTQAQPENVKLSRQSFLNCHKEAQDLLHSGWGGLSSKEMAQTMEASLILSDMGKSGLARLQFKEATAPDHDDFYEEAMYVLVKHPERAPSFAALPEAGKKLLGRVANLIHYGHASHIEGGPWMYKKIYETQIALKDPTALAFDFFIHRCDVMGAAGHVNPHSSLVYTKVTHLFLQGVHDALMQLTDAHKTHWDAYNYYLERRAASLGLNSKDRSERALTRIGTMCRLHTRKEGEILRNAFSLLDSETREIIIRQFDTQAADPEMRTPTYMPAVLVNLMNNPIMGITTEEKLTQAIVIGLPFISKVLVYHAELIKKGAFNPHIPLCFNSIAGIAKSTPALLVQKTFSIDTEGNVVLNEDFSGCDEESIF